MKQKKNHIFRRSSCTSRGDSGVKPRFIIDPGKEFEILGGYSWIVQSKDVGNNSSLGGDLN